MKVGVTVATCTVVVKRVHVSGSMQNWNLDPTDLFASRGIFAGKIPLKHARRLVLHEESKLYPRLNYVEKPY